MVLAVPAICKRPAPVKINLFRLTLAPIAKSPEQVNWPLLIFTKHLLELFPELVLVTEVHIIIPSPTLSELLVAPEAGGMMLMIPVTVNVMPTFILMLELAFREPLPILSERQDALMSTLTEWLFAMVTTSVGPGTIPPDHIKGLLQFPELVEEIGAATKWLTNNKSTRKLLKYSCFIARG